MNGLREIQDNIIKFICEKEFIQQEIAQIEKQRNELAQKRNELKKSGTNNIEIEELGNQIAKLGNQSQENQSKLDSISRDVKLQVNLMLDNLVAEGIRKIRKIGEEVTELEDKINKYTERNAKYELQKQEFYLRFGRMPELSENAKKENTIQEKENKNNSLNLKELELQTLETEQDISMLATAKREIKYGNWKYIIENCNKVEEIYIEPLSIEAIETIEEISIEDIEPIEELYIEEFMPIEEIKIEEENSTNEIDQLAKAIIEEIIATQEKIAAESENIEEDVIEENIVPFEEKKVVEEKKAKVIRPLFGQRAVIENIIIKFEEENLLYKAQMSDGEEIKIYPSKLGEQSVLLRDKQNREECGDILINYAMNEYKPLDKKVINKIDPLVCELLIECAEEYSYDAQELIYNYAMSFSNIVGLNTENVPGIIYNLSYMEDSELTRKEKGIINKICKNARKNKNVEIIESFTGFTKIKYILKKLFTVNNVKVLPEAKN